MYSETDCPGWSVSILSLLTISLGTFKPQCPGRAAVFTGFYQKGCDTKLTSSGLSGTELELHILLSAVSLKISLFLSFIKIGIRYRSTGLYRFCLHGSELFT